MVNSFRTKGPRIHKGERTTSSINGVGKDGVHMKKNITGPSYTIHKN